MTFNTGQLVTVGCRCRVSRTWGTHRLRAVVLSFDPGDAERPYVVELRESVWPHADGDTGRFSGVSLMPQNVEVAA